MDLWDLQPAEFKAALYLQSVDGRATGAEVAEILNVSPATGRRILSSLVDQGYLSRLSRGRFQLLWLSVERSSLSVERSPVSVSKVHSLVGSSHMPVVAPSGATTGAAPPSRAQENFSEVRFPVADDLEPGRLKPTAPKSPKRTLYRKPDKYHRLTQPPETWTVAHVVKEFEIRSQQALPNSIYVPEGKKLSVTLNMAARDYGLTVSQMMTALDQFFTHRAHKVPDDMPPTRYFLQYLKDYIEQQPDFKGSVNLDFDTAPTSGDRYEKEWL